MKKFIALSVMALFCVAVAGCGEKTAGEKLDAGVKEVEKKADELKK